MNTATDTDRPSEGFAGFRAGLGIVDELPGWTREDYHDRKPRVASELIEPARALVGDIGDRLRSSVDDGLVWETKVGASISPLNRDQRFARDTSTLYKDHLLLTWWGGTDRRRTPTLWLRLTAEDVGFSSGLSFDRPVRDRWRDAVAGSPGAELEEAVTTLVSATGAEVHGQELKRVPAPWGADHPRADLLRHKGFWVRWSEPLPTAAKSARFVPWVARRLEQCGPVHRWLQENLT